MKGKGLFIINRWAGTRYQARVESLVSSLCLEQGIEPIIDFTADRGHGTELARDGVKKGFDLIVAVGGDGTVNEVAQGMLHTSVPMGILPNGSGNGLARHIGMPVDPSRALRTLFQCKPLCIDTFTVNDHLGVNVAGIGFDGLIANLFQHATKRGLPGYVKLTLREFFSFKDFPLHIAVNGSAEERSAFMIAIANSSQYGNNARIAPSASLCDSILQVALVRKVPFFRIPAFALALFSGRVERQRQFESLTASSLTITTPAPAPYHIDGEARGTSSKFQIKVDPGSLHILVPASRADSV